MATNCLFKSRRYNINGSYKYNYYFITRLIIDLYKNVKIEKKKLSSKKYLKLKKKLENFDLFNNKEDFIILGNKQCKWCSEAKKLLLKKKIPFVYQKIEISDILTQITNNYKYIPIIFYKNIFIGGYNELILFLDNYEKKDLIYFNYKDKNIINKILKKK